MREHDLLRLVWITDPRISPDGLRVAFTRVAVDAEADEYVTSLMICDAGPPRNGSPAQPRRLTGGPRDSQPRWSPDGGSLAFVRSLGSGKPTQLCVLPMAGGESRVVAQLEGSIASPAWSPDGTRIAFTSGTNPTLDTPDRKKPKNEASRVVTRPEFRWNNEGFVDADHLDHVWVVDVPASADAPATPPRALTTGQFKEMSPAWSRDGARILFLSDRRPEPWFGSEDVDLYAVSPDLAEPTSGEALALVADIRGPITAFVEGPDGRIAAAGGFRQDPPRSYEQNDLLIFDGPWPSTQPAVPTRAYDFDFGSDDISSDQHPPRGGGSKPLAFSADGRQVIGVVCRHGAGRLARVDLGSDSIEELTDAAHEVVTGSATPDGSRFALVMGSLERPGDLWIHDMAQGRSRLLWAPNEALFAGTPLGPVEEIWYPSFDGRMIHGWIVKPPGFDPAKKYPLILEIHGGPHVAYGVGFFHEFRMLAAAGYVVLYTNPRGSTTYGKEFGNIIQYAYPGDDYQDLMAGVDLVVSRGYIDESRMGVTGGSGGGLLTNWIITRTDRFAAAITQRCVADWASMYASSDFAMFQPFWFRKAPFEDPAEYQERSPATFATRIRTPLMVIHSEEDWRTPIAQGETMFRALKHQKKPTVMVRFPGENHELSRSGAPSRRVQNQVHIRRWFDHWLMGIPAEDYGIHVRR